ncbi:hypothetical protein [Pseudomonas sp. Marseille-Q5115]|uniref:hypothetical protein n=1 Tax=Pseudomonas sp. Marseille-Q5115 TaxID=2866593 RepID=UPI001CE4000A|nr:hypothetical protein [Pseudomonas sp. Marseille-Q5115]
MTPVEIGGLALLILITAFAWKVYDKHKLRPLSEFPDLAEDFKLFPTVLEKIRARGALSLAEYRLLLKRSLGAVDTELARRKNENP